MQFDRLIQQSLIWRGFYFIGILLLNVVLSRYLQAELSGLVYFLANIFAFLLIPASLNLESGFTYFASSGSIAANSLAMLGICWSVCSTLLVFPLLYWYFGQYPPSSSVHIHITTLCGWGVAYITGLMLSNYASVLYYAKRNYAIPNIVLGVGNLLLVMGMWLLPASANKIMLMHGFFVLFLLQGLFLYGVFGWQNRSAAWQMPTRAALKQLVNYCGVTLLANTLFFLVYKIDYWFVRYYCSPAALGNYIQAAKLGQMLLIVPQILASAVFPQTASGQQQHEVGTAIVRIFRLLIQLFAMGTLLVAITGKWLFIAVFGATFNEMYGVMLILLPGICCLAMLSLMSAFLLGKGKILQELLGAVIGLAVMLAGDMYLIPRWGILGAALVSTLAYFANWWYILYCFGKLYPANFWSLFKFNVADWLWLRTLLIKKND